jgi:hypothetical protein
MSPVAVVALVALVGCSGRQTAIGAGIGVGGIAVGGALIATDSSSEGSGQAYFGFGMAVAGVGLVVVSLIGGALGLIRLPPSPPHGDVSGGRTCRPVAPDSSWWTCGEGYRCTEDFASCEPAVGTPLRQR